MIFLTFSNFLSTQNNIIGTFMRLEQLLTTNGYTKDDLIIISNPTSDQVAVLISSASLIADAEQSARKSLSNQVSVEQKVVEVPELEVNEHTAEKVEEADGIVVESEPPAVAEQP